MCSGAVDGGGYSGCKSVEIFLKNQNLKIRGVKSSLKIRWMDSVKADVEINECRRGEKVCARSCHMDERGVLLICEFL
jgi:hypothetical protein